jgi:acyl-CoA synthetase (AMP-forming)/AMP-acid ligase II
VERHFATLWESIADAVGHDIAIVQGDVRRSWAAFDERAARLSTVFVEAGLRPGATVAQFLLNGPEYLETFAAALKHELVPVNVNYRYLDDELLYLLTNSDAEALVCHASLYGRVARVRGRAPSLRRVLVVDDDPDAFAEVAPEERYEDALAAAEPAPRIGRTEQGHRMMLYTGGTTGIPKGVVTPLSGLLGAYLSAVPTSMGLPPLSEPEQAAPFATARNGAGAQIGVLVACPLMHGTGLNLGALPYLVFGGRVVLVPGGGFDPAVIWDLMESERLQFLTLVGDAMARPLLRELREGRRRDLSAVVAFVSSGAMFSAEVKAGLLELVPSAYVIDYIAATEGTMGYSIAMPDQPIPTGRFTPMPGVKVLAEDGREVEPGSGEAGMVVVGGAIPDGYYHDEAKTASTFRMIDGRRYSIPGDWATVEADGQICLLGRGSQCINTGGEKVYPEEVEEVVKTHPAVEDCLVFGVPDERFGQRVVGVASLAPDATGSVTSAEEILAEARTRLASYKLPRTLVLVPQVPRAPNGKADYPSARDLFAGVADS